MNTVHRAVILAAGCGRRLGGTTPKCLLPLGRRTLLDRQVRALAAVGVRDVTIVVGYRQELVRAECARLQRLLDVSFDFVYNPDFAHSNTAYSLYLACRAVMDDGFFCLNGDVLFAPDLICALQSALAANTLLVEVKPCGVEEVKVMMNGSRIVRIGKVLPLEVCLGEFIGVARFSKEIGRAFSAALETLTMTEGRCDEYFEAALDRIAGDVELTALTTEGQPIIEIDFPEDFAYAQTLVLPRIDAAVETPPARVGPQIGWP